MNIRQLKYFLTIAEEGQITSAANKLNISQPPLSYQLKLLENELGVMLFQRNTRSMVLTDEGRLLQKHARNILREYEGTLNEFAGIKDGKSGELYIAAICSAALNFLPLFITGFLELYPDVNTQIFEVDSTHIPELLSNNTVELGIVREPFDHSQYNYLYIDNLGINPEEDYFVTVSLANQLPPQYADAQELPLSALNGKPLIIHRFYEEQTKALCEENHFSPHFICTNENVMTSLIWALKGLGIALVPKSSAQLISALTGYEKLVIKKIADCNLSSNTALIWAKDAYISPTALNFIRFVQKP